MATEPANRTAVVTGGNRGIGFEICRQLAASGVNVILTARDAIAGSKAAAKLVKKDYPVTFHLLDVADPEIITAFADHIRDRSIGIDILINNAGISMKGFDANVVRKTMAVNFFGAMHLTDTLMPSMAPDGRIVMVSSGLGKLSCLSPDRQDEFIDPKLTREGLTDLVNRFESDVEAGFHTKHGWPRSAYSVSKVALNALTRILAKELAESDIRINSVCPGWVRTRMGGRFALRSVRKGAETITWAATLPTDGPQGAFLRDHKQNPW